MQNRFLYLTICMWYLLMANTTFAYTRQDSLRGGNGNGRNWWDVTRYDLFVRFDTATKSITGQNHIMFKLTGSPGDSMQIDLQDAMLIDSILYNGKQLRFSREGNVWWITSPAFVQKSKTEQNLIVYYHGSPRVGIL